jgi:hypothetical protein
MLDLTLHIKHHGTQALVVYVYVMLNVALAMTAVNELRRLLQRTALPLDVQQAHIHGVGGAAPTAANVWPYQVTDSIAI